MISRNWPSKLLKYCLSVSEGASSGFTLIEALITISVLGVLTAIAAPTLTRAGNPLADATNQVASQFRAVRTKAIAQTSQFRIRPDGPMPPATGIASEGSSTQLIVERSTSTYIDCNDTTAANWQRDASFTQLQNQTPGDLTFGKGTGDITLNNAQIDPTTTSANYLSVPTGWMLCFNPRGIPTVINRSTATVARGSNLVLHLRRTSNSAQQRIEIFPGGVTQVYVN